MLGEPPRRPRTNGPVWVFGYGSLVHPVSVVRSVGRRPVPGVDYHPATLIGHRRAWNYGSPRQWVSFDGPRGRVERGVAIFLGIAPVDDRDGGDLVEPEGCLGAITRVSRVELAMLDRRESDYDRVDVTDLVDADAVDATGERVVTYVPTLRSIDRYRTARAEGRAAVRRSYIDTVEDAFRELGAAALDRYRRTTPHPDVPVVEFVPHSSPPVVRSDRPEQRRATEADDG